MIEHRPYGDHGGLGLVAPEHRSASYTDVLVSALVQHAAGTGTLSPLGLGVLETASGLLGRALALATVQPQNSRTRALTPSVRAAIGRGLLRHGETVHVLHAASGGLVLVQAHSWDVSGLPFGDWRYTVDVSGPDDTSTRSYPAEAVLHCRLATDPAHPWIGVAPLAWASTTSKLGTALETRLGQEANTPVGNLITTARDAGAPGGEGEDDPLAGLKRDLASMRGEAVLVESQTTGTGEPRGEGPRRDWQPQRLGAAPPASLPTLRQDAEHCLAGALALPAALLSPNADGTAAREAFRPWHHGTLLPVAELVCEEVERVLETPCRMTFERLEAGDVAGRARAYGQLVKAGIRGVKAAELAGLQGVTERDIEEPTAPPGTPAQAGSRGV